MADKVDSLRDALYPRRVFYDRHGLPRAEPWTVVEVAELVHGTDGVELLRGESDDVAAFAAADHLTGAAAGTDGPMAQWAPWAPRELLETGAVKSRRMKRLPKPIRRGATVVMPEVARPVAKKPRAERSGSRSGGDDESGSSSAEDDALSGMNASDDDDGGSSGGDELTM